MGIRQKKITVYICDRCHFKTDNPLVGGQNTLLKRRIEVGSYNSDANGGSAEAEEWLCGGCTTDMIKFMSGEAISGVELEV